MTNMGGVNTQWKPALQATPRVKQRHLEGELRRIAPVFYMPEDVWDSLGTTRLQPAMGFPSLRTYTRASFSEIRRTPRTYPHPEPVTVNPPFGPALVFSPVATIADLATRFGIRDAVRAGDILVAEQPGLLDDLHQASEKCDGYLAPRVPG